MEPPATVSVSGHGNLAYLGAGLQINHFTPGTPESLATLSSPTIPPEPRDPKNFLGRSEDLRAAHSRLLDGAGGLWVEGATGVGKSELARHLARELRHEGVTVWWVRAADQQTILGALVSIAYQAGAREEDFRYMHPADVFLRTVERWADPWCIVLDDWAVTDPGGDLDAAASRWIRRPPEHGRFLVTSVRRPGAEFGWFTRTELGHLSADAAARILVAYAPDAGTLDEAVSLARALHFNAAALVGAGRYLQRARRQPLLDPSIQRTFLDYEAALQSIADEESAGDLFPYFNVVARTVDLLESQGLGGVGALTGLISVFPDRPLPVAVLESAVEYPLLSGLTTRRLSRGLDELAALRILDVDRNAAGDTLEMHGLFRSAQRLVGRVQGGVMENLDTAVSLLSDWTAAHPAHVPSEWKVWQIASPVLQQIGNGLGDARADPVRQQRLDELARRAAEFHYLAGQYEIAEASLRPLVGRMTEAETDPSLAVSTKVLLARVRREQGDFDEARELLSDSNRLAAERLGINDTPNREARLSLARTLREEGRVSEALELLTELVEIDAPFPKPGGTRDQNLTDWATLLNIGRCYRELGTAEQAVPITQRLCDSWDSWCSNSSLHYIDTQYEHAENLAAAGAFNLASELHNANITLARKLLGSDHLNVLIMKARILQANYAGLGPLQLDRKRKSLHAAISERFGTAHPLAVAVADGG